MPNQCGMWRGCLPTLKERVWARLLPNLHRTTCTEEWEEWCYLAEGAYAQGFYAMCWEILDLMDTLRVR